MPFFKSPNTIDWYYDVEGEGQVLVFLHGWGVDRRIWRQQVKHFQKFCCTVTIDLPGHGQSSWQDVSLKLMAEDIHEILQARRAAPLTLIGSSLGGLVALKYYDLFPSTVERLVLVGAMAKFAKSADHPYGLDIEQMRHLENYVETEYPSIVNVFFRSLFTNEERQTRRFIWLQKFRQRDVPPAQKALVKYLDILEKEDLRGVLRRIKVPTQIVSGEKDPICDRPSVEFLRNQIPGARFDEFKDCGHFPFLSKAYEFNAVLEDFLKKS